MPLSEITFLDERQLQDVADTIATAHKILVITGAGISTSVGIPDFRSKDGLYNLIPEQTLLPTPPPSNPSTPSKKEKVYTTDDEELPSSQSSVSSTSSRRSSAVTNSKLRGQDLFDARVFQHAESTTMFYQFIASLRQKIRDEVKDSSATHKFVRTLRDGGRLMRYYTQNIDGLEAREGLCMDLARGRGNKRRFMKKHYEAPLPQQTQGTDFDGGCEVVQLHGDLDKLRCNMCAANFLWTDDETNIFVEGCAPKCQKCATKSDQRQATGKRGLSVGSLRPNIVLYGEDHPSNTLLAPFVPFDAGSQPEVLIIMGTSLKVFGLQKIVREFAKAVHAQKNGKGRVIFVNRTRPAESVWDGVIDDFVSMDCDDWIDDLKKRRADLWLRQGEIDLNVTKKATSKRKRKSESAENVADQPPAKKLNITVEIPRFVVKPVSKARKSSKPTLPSTPRHEKATPWTKALQENYPGRKLFSPLARARRPTPSPLSNSFRPVFCDEAGNIMVPGSPRTPVYSPITPKIVPGSMLRLPIDADEVKNVEILDSDQEKENEAGVPSQPPYMSVISFDGACDVPDTPSKGLKGRHTPALVDVGNTTARFEGVKQRMATLSGRNFVGMIFGTDWMGSRMG